MQRTAWGWCTRLPHPSALGCMGVAHWSAYEEDEWEGDESKEDTLTKIQSLNRC